MSAKGVQKSSRACEGGDNTRVLCVTSGKGGVGKTNITVNLAYALTRLGKKVLIMDADLALANVDLLLGMNPEFHLGHVLNGEKRLSEVIVEGPGGIKVIPSGSGLQELTQLSDGQKLQLLSELELLDDNVDVLLIDTASGISSNVLYFASASNEIVVVSSPEPTSIADVYALMKLMHVRYSTRRFMLLVNGAQSQREAQKVFQDLCQVADKFLNISIQYLGFIPDDSNLPRAVKQQKAVVQMYPSSRASIGFMSLAKKICQFPAPQSPSGNMSFFWNKVLRGSHGISC